jgi:hypothetical protein
MMLCLSTPCIASSSDDEEEDEDDDDGEDMLRFSSSSGMVGRNPRRESRVGLLDLSVEVIEGSSGDGHEAEEDDAS